MSAARIVTVFGGTGLQGSSVVKALLADGTFTPRVVTRNPASHTAQNLQRQGVEIVQANLRDVQSLRDALKGSECVFGLTQFAPLDEDFDEVQEGKNLVDACKDVDVKLFVWSSLPNVTADSGGKYTRVAHFDNKAKVEEYLPGSGVPYTVVRTAYFLENLVNFGQLQKTSLPDQLTFSLPLVPGSTAQVITWIERDLGPSVLALCKQYRDQPQDILGQTFIVARTRVTYDELCASLGQALGKQITYVSGPSSGLVDVDEMYLHIQEFDMHGHKSIPDPKLVALGVDFSAPVSDYAEDLKRHGF